MLLTVCTCSVGVDPVSVSRDWHFGLGAKYIYILMNGVSGLVNFSSFYKNKQNMHTPPKS